jgi:cell division protein FtsW
MNKIFNNLKGDRTIWIIVITLFALSILAVYSSSATLAVKYGDTVSTERYILLHLFYWAIGLTLMWGIHKMNYKWLSRISQILFYVSIPLLFYTLLFGEKGRWIVIPFPIKDISIQPSDIAKLALIMFLARMMSMKKDSLHDFKDGFLRILAPIATICGLIFFSDFSTAGVIFVICFLMMYIAGVDLKHLGILSGIGLVIAVGFGLYVYLNQDVGRFGTWVSRTVSYFSGEGNYQSNQAKMAIANGGLFGNLPGSSQMKNFLPQAHNDFIYAIIIEEYGFLIGGLAPVLLYLTLLYRGVQIYLKSSNYFGSFMVLGITIGLLLQATINMGVAVGIFPVTGQALPLVSMGGTSIVFTCISIGIIQSVSYTEEKAKLAAEEALGNDESDAQNDEELQNE